jgi:aryl-alcohol dehydrogenase-like predicted oxidoreductase
MRYVELPAAGAKTKVSVLGFGCAALLGRASRKESLTALGAAMDAGITFYDTARSYGYGESETLLGEFFAGRRQDVVICTKFGIVPAAKGGWKQRVKPLAQAAIKLVPALRSVARSAAAGTSSGGQFSVQVLRESFETSLRELKTDYVDMLLLHAAPVEVLAQADLLEAMQRLVESGKVRMAGISGEHDVVAATLAQKPAALTTAQFAVNRTNLQFARDLNPAGMFLVGNHPFGGPAGVAATVTRIAAMRQSATLPAELRAKLDPADPQLMPEILLNVILDGTAVSAIVPAMMRTANLRSNVRAIEQCRFTPAELALLRDDLIKHP